MKRKIIGFLIAALIACNIIPAFAAEDENNSMVVSFSTIKEIMLDNSIQLKIAENNYKKTKQNYEKLQDEIDDLEDELSSLSKPTDTEAEDYEERLASYKSSYNSISSSLESKEHEEEVYEEYTLKNARITYQTTVQSKVYEAQKAYINYLNKLDILKLNENEAEADSKDVNISKEKYNYGFISKSEYENTIIEKNGNWDNYDLYKRESDEALQNLYYLLGVSEDDNVIIETNVEDLFNELESINYAQDVNEMLSNNYAIKSKKLEIDKMDLEIDYAEDDDEYEYDEDNAELNLQGQVIQAELDFRSAYNTLMTSYNSFKTSYDKVNKSRKTYEVEKEQNILGFVSDNTLAKDRRELENSLASLSNSRNNVYLNYINYLQMKEGY